ncbi:MAG: septum formation family protein [Actinobacteria bacterium]|nr:septum formation family protein [Actinomycetota bacterium]
MATTAHPGRRRRGGPLAAGLVAVVLVAAGCSGGDDGASAPSDPGGPASIDIETTTTDPLADVAAAGSPAVGICRPVLSVEERRAAYETRPSVRCTDPHGAEVVASFELPPATAEAITPELIEAGGAEFESVMGETANTCSGRANDAIQQIIDIDLAGTPFTGAFQATVLDGAYFLPSPDEWRAGERWMVCEVTAVRPDGESVAFTGPLTSLGRTRILPAELGTCVDDALTFVVCEGDASRAVASGNVGAGDPPTDAEAAEGCRTLVAHLGATIPDDRTLRTEVRALDEDTSAVYCLVSGPDPLPAA